MLISTTKAQHTVTIWSLCQLKTTAHSFRLEVDRSYESSPELTIGRHALVACVRIIGMTVFSKKLNNFVIILSSINSNL